MHRHYPSRPRLLNPTTVARAADPPRCYQACRIPPAQFIQLTRLLPQEIIMPLIHGAHVSKAMYRRMWFPASSSALCVVAGCLRSALLRGRNRQD